MPASLALFLKNWLTLAISCLLYTSGSGSVVTKDIPDSVIAAGNPCKVIRMITNTDKEYWLKPLEEFEADTGAVSYTHLDVYKRQLLVSIEN